MREMGNPGCDNDGVSPTPGPAGPGSPGRGRPGRRRLRLPGTLTERMTRCGHPGCRCHADPPRLHGPYHQWTRKIAGKTVTRILTDDQLADYQPWFDNQRRLRALVAELEPSARKSPTTTPAGTARQPRQLWARSA